MNWLGANAPSLINITGLLFDIVGAFLVVSEIVAEFRGEQFKHGPTPPSGTGPVAPPPPKETDDFSQWNSATFRKIRPGLLFLVFGFVLQITANVIQLVRDAV